MKKKEDHLTRNFGNYILVYFISLATTMVFIGRQIFNSEFANVIGGILLIMISSFILTSVVYLFVVLCIGVGKIIKKGGE